MINIVARINYHQGDHGPIAPTNTDVTDYSPWKSMYRKDLYARDRVMKSARLLLAVMNEGDTILDVGCFTQEARKYFPRTMTYKGLDGQKYHKDTQVVDLNHGFEPIPARGILCLETLEHLVDPLDTLESIEKSLLPGGYLVVSLPNENTLFHRLRALFGTVDSECFSGEGKHLHLPSLHQSRLFLSGKFRILKELYYISPSGCGSRQVWLGKVLKLIPDFVHQFLADKIPSLFSRGFIFLLQSKNKVEVQSTSIYNSVSVRPPKIDLTGNG